MGGRVDLDYYMGLAIEAAKRVMPGQRPFGTIIVSPENNVIGIAAGTETHLDPTKHSELVAIRMACRQRGGLLHDCTMFQTMEPCHGCCGFIKHSKLSRIVIGSWRNEFPQLFRQCNIRSRALLSDTTHPPEVVGLKSFDRTAVKCRNLFHEEIIALTSAL